MKEQFCCDCGKTIHFEDFLKINPKLTHKQAEKLWELPVISKYCLNCFLNRPEKPYKDRSRRFFCYKFKKGI
ncbi:MAG: hypothetical protein P8Y70_13385 [Candidatus Lokiarchaeota archaeon]